MKTAHYPNNPRKPLYTLFIISLVLLFILVFQLFAQAQTMQVVKGQIIDKGTKQALADVTVSCKQYPELKTKTDNNGVFTLKNIATGRVDLTFTKIGFQTVDLSNILVSAGREVRLSVEMDISLTVLNEVQVVATKKRGKEKPLNDMAQVSSRMFSVEETQRYAGALDDPARMVAVYPGVQSGSSTSNQIIIRGNSSKGLTWRIEGMEAFNPNHYSEEGSSYGGISMITSAVLANSDFSTGAFAAEYGNALSGVFDIHLRKGNPDKHEFSLQAGTLGVEVGAEGPMFKGGSSYLLKYRYSSLALASKAGLVEFAPFYQDLIFNLNVPTKKAGSFTFYGIGGDGTSTSKAEKDPKKWAESKFFRFGDDFNTLVGMAGITHTYKLNKAYIYSGISYNDSQATYSSDSIRNDLSLAAQEYSKFSNQALRFSTVINYRFNPKNTIRAGGSFSMLNFKNYVIDMNDTIPGQRDLILNHKGNSSFSQVFTEWKFRPVNALTFVSGVHFLKFNLNGNYVMEPRFSASYKVTPNKSVSFGYGLHSKLESVATYTTDVKLPTGGTAQLNRDLDLSKAHHFVLAYDWQLSSKMRFKAETYYQSLFNVPVGFSNDGTASALNSDGFNYSAEQYYNKGKGKNYGLELTLERFFDKGSYFMLTGSVFRSLYTDILNREHATAFDRKYLLTFVAGKEWKVGDTRQNLIQANFKLVFSGPYHFTPIDMQQSKNKGYTVYNYGKGFSEADDLYIKPDLKIAFKRNLAHSNWSTGLDLVNASGKAYKTGQAFDETNGKIKNFTDAIGMFPNLFYKWEF